MSKEEKETKFFASLKFEFPDKFLLSLRAGSGIEFARIFLNRDTLMINDRVNKILHYGLPDDLKMKYGLSSSIIPIIFGDLVGKVSDQRMLETFENKKFDVNCNDKGIQIRYTIDGSKDKVSVAVAQAGSGKNKILIDYSRYRRIDDKIIPGLIIIRIGEIYSNVEVRIKKIDLNWGDTIIFLPGKGYKLLKIS